MNHCKTIAIVNQKGGVGKTTSTVNLGVGLAQAGNRVLLADDDPQHSLTISLGIRNADEALDTTLATAMQAEIRDEPVPWEEGIIHSGEWVDLLPANIELSGVEMSLFNAMSREQVLKSVLSRVKESYDYILIDCMPSLGLMSINALAAADSVIIPSAPDFLSTKGSESAYPHHQQSAAADQSEAENRRHSYDHGGRANQQRQKHYRRPALHIGRQRPGIRHGNPPLCPSRRGIRRGKEHFRL